MQVELDDIWLDKMEGWTGFSRKQKRRLYRVFMVLAIGVSYLLDTLLYALFAMAGTIGWSIVLAYGAAGLGHVIIFSSLHWSGLSERSANAHLAPWQMSYALLAQLGCMTVAPQLAPLFIGIMMIVFAFGIMRLDLRSALGFWLLSFLAITLVLTLPEHQSVGLVDPSRVEIALMCLSYSLIVLRTLLIGYYTAAMRTRLHDLNFALGQAKTNAEHIAAHDQLTGAMSRRAVLPLIEECIDLCTRTGQTTCVAIVDIDWFKSINDRLGHLAGDRVLKRLVERIRDCMRESDRLGRFGGEEFVLILQRVDIADGLRLAERIRTAIRATDWSDIAPGLEVSISCGITRTRPADELDSVLLRADHALYEAKREGRDRVCTAW